MKIKLVTLILIIVLLVGGGLGAYVLLKDKDIGLMKTSKNDNGIVFNNAAEENAIVNSEIGKNQISNSLAEGKITQEIKEVSKTNTEKIQANQKLLDKLYNSICDINESELLGNKIISYNENLLNNEAVKYYIVWENIPKSNFEYDKDSNGNEVTGAANVSCKIFNQYYKSIFGQDADFDKIVKEDIAYGITIKNDTIYGTRATGRGEPEFALKVDNIMYNPNEETYTITIDYLKFSNDEKITSEEIEKISEPSTLTWDEKLNYAKIEIQYKKASSDNYRLLSMVFKKI